jgi:protein-tyrosine phosphatase
LEDSSTIDFDRYCGPTPESNWVLPGVFLVGAYPASQDDAETFDLLTSILKNGITKFVCLQQEYRAHGVTEAMWRNGLALRPYYEDVVKLVNNKSKLDALKGFNIVDPDKLSFVHFPIRDCDITDDDRVLEVAKSLVKAIGEGEKLYLHCWGGHGRTGTLVSIMLHLMYKLDSVQAMARCQQVHDLRQCPVAVGSPQTQTQRDQVTRIISRMVKSRGFYKRSISENTRPVNSLTVRTDEQSPRPTGSNFNSNSSSIDVGESVSSPNTPLKSVPGSPSLTPLLGNPGSLPSPHSPTNGSTNGSTSASPPASPTTTFSINSISSNRVATDEIAASVEVVPSNIEIYSDNNITINETTNMSDASGDNDVRMSIDHYNENESTEEDDNGIRDAAPVSDSVSAKPPSSSLPSSLLNGYRNWRGGAKT